MSTPEWAARHNYWHHSNPRSKPLSKTLFDKAHVRPLVKQAWDIYRSDWATDDDREDAFKTIHRLDQNYNGSRSAKMYAGVLVQEACDRILLQNKDPAESCDLALQKYMDYVPRDWDNGIDAEDWSNCQGKLVDVIRCSVEGLREAMKKSSRVFGEIDLKGCLPNNQVEHFNKPDYVGVGDLKTKWPKRNTRTKKGFSEASLPKDLSGMFDLNNVYQVAGGWWINGKKPVWLLYSNGNDYTILNQDNCEQLQPEYLEQVVAETSRMHKLTEKMLKASETKEELLEWVVPDFTQLQWQEPPGYLEEAHRIFQ